MISVLIYSCIEPELKHIIDRYKRVASVLSDIPWSFDATTDPDAAGKVVSESVNLDIACIDVTADNGILLAEKIHKQYSSCAIILISDQTISPVTYIKPSICASALILRPFSDSYLCNVLKEVYNSGRLNSKEKNNDCFTLENKEGCRMIPYDKIFYFEARGKKIVVGTEFEELSFYGTIESLSEKLPEEFVRCHRSFILSTKKISVIRYSGNTIKLTNGSIIPVSRTYKNAVKELFV